MFNKRGSGEWVLSGGLLFMLIIVALGIVWITVLFYGKPYDVRQIESRLLFGKVGNCVSYLGRINPEIISNGKLSIQKFNFLDSCHINFNSDEQDGEQYYVRISIFLSSDLDNSLVTFSKGEEELNLDCKISEVATYKKSATCLEKSFTSFDDLNQEYTIKILTAVKKLRKNVN